MEPLLVRDWLHTDVVTINPELRIERVWELMEHKRVRHLPVVKNDQLGGIVTDRDLKRALFPAPPTFPGWREGKPQPSGSPGDLPAEAIMTKGVYTTKPDEPLLNPARRMLNEKIGAVPVVDDTGRLVGILTETDLLKALVFLLEWREPVAARST
jgi:CBS domain-containing protein